MISRKSNSKFSQIVEPMRKQDSFDWLVFLLKMKISNLKKITFSYYLFPFIDDFTPNSDEIKGF